MIICISNDSIQAKSGPSWISEPCGWSPTQAPSPRCPPSHWAEAQSPHPDKALFQWGQVRRKKNSKMCWKANKHWHPPPWCSPTCAWWRQTSLQPSIYVKNYICCLCHISCRFILTQHLWSLPRCQPRRFSHHWTWAWWQTSSGCWVVSEDVFFVSYGPHNIELKCSASSLNQLSCKWKFEQWSQSKQTDPA